MRSIEDLLNAEDENENHDRLLNLGLKLECQARRLYVGEWIIYNLMAI